MRHSVAERRHGGSREEDLLCRRGWLGFLDAIDRLGAVGGRNQLLSQVLREDAAIVRLLARLACQRSLGPIKLWLITCVRLASELNMVVAVALALSGCDASWMPGGPLRCPAWPAAA